MRRVTIKDIARIAGVSYATVSRALSNSSEISAPTRERILKICQQEGYRVNVLARSLICSKTNVLGLIIPDITDPFYSELSLNIETYARKQGYSVMLCNSQQNGGITRELFEFLIGHQVDGIILASSRGGTRQLVSEYWETVPTVLLGDCSHDDDDGDEINTVTVDNRYGGRLAAEYLHRLGHKKVIYLGLCPSSVTRRQRFRGFQHMMQKLGASVRAIEDPEGVSSIQRGHFLGNQLFAHSVGEMDETAIFAATDLLALGVLQAAEEVGIRVPEDISLLGFDNTIYSSLPRIMLSTIDQRKQSLAHAAVNLLIEMVDDPMQESCTRQAIKPVLIERQSCKNIK